MKWMTASGVRVGRTSSAWLIRRFVDPDAEFLFAPWNEVNERAGQEGAMPFHVPGSELGKDAQTTAFERIIWKYQLDADPVLVLMAHMINAADTENSTSNQAEGPGIKAIADGMLLLEHRDDLEVIDRLSVVYDALYALCRQRATGN